MKKQINAAMMLMAIAAAPMRMPTIVPTGPASGRNAAPGEAERWLKARLVRQDDGSYYLPHAKKLALYAFPA